MAEPLPTFGAAEKPADCLRAIARIWESSAPLGRAELLALLPIIEIARVNLDSFRYQTINLLGLHGVKCEGPPEISLAKPSGDAPPPDLPPEAFRRA